MPSYRTHFQCPASGLTVEAVYGFGRLAVLFDEEDARRDYGPEQSGGSEEEWQEAVEATTLWADRVKGRYGSKDIAQHALEREGVDGYDAYLEAY